MEIIQFEINYCWPKEVVVTVLTFVHILHILLLLAKMELQLY